MSDPENTLILKLNQGNVSIQLLPDVAPNHVERIKLLASESFYDNCPFHRVIEGFMAQTGDGSNQDGTGGSDYPNLTQEFNSTAHERGVVSMARAASPNSANSQFFICYDNCPHLDNQYTVFGRVTDGMDLIDSLKKGAPGSGSVTAPDRILKAYILADSPE
ncbi:MAG: peptidylprolyl isomerase [Pseudomonadota bacterium]|nr:peptidylprolyl isomerase [Pseudomonadota bacterium]